MFKQSLTIGLIAVGLSISACDGGGQEQQTAIPASAAPINQALTRDLAALDLCAVMPDQLVGQLLDNTVTQPGRRQDYGVAGQGCEYSLGRAERGTGEGPFEYVFVFVSPAANFGTLKDSLATDQGLGQQVSGQPVAGLGDQAFAIDNRTERATSLHVLVQGDVALEIKANDLDHAGKLAKALLERLEK